MLRTRSLALLFVVAPLAFAFPSVQSTVAQSSAQRSDLVRELVDSELLASGDVDRWAERVVELLAGATGSSPVDEAAIHLLAQRADDFAEPERWPRLLGRLAQLKGLDAHTRSLVMRLATEDRLSRMDLSDLEPASERDAFPEYLASFRMLAPLSGPERDDTPSFADLARDPGFEREHRGLRGERVRWTTGRRANLRAEIVPAEWMEPVEGLCVLAFEFDAPEGGAAAIEFDLRGSYAMRSLPFLLAQDRAWRASVGDPTWSHSINGAAPTLVDVLARETAPVLLVPFERLAGRNRVLVHCRADAYWNFAVRVLVADASGSGGRPVAYAPLDERAFAATSSRLGAAAGRALGRWSTFAERLPRGSAEEKALTGLVLCSDDQPIAGLELLRLAADEAADQPRIQALHARFLSEAPYLPETWRRSRARAALEALSTRGAGLDVEVALARTEVFEDKEELALQRLGKARTQYAHVATPLLELARTLPRLELDADGDAAREAAQELAPRSGRVIDAEAGRLASQGRLTRAAEARGRLCASIGGSVGNLRVLSGALARTGDAAGALQALHRAALRSGRLGLASELSDFHFDRGEWELADAHQEQLARAYPRWSGPVLRRAEIARRRGDAVGERALLEEARRREPGSSVAREGLRALGVEDQSDALFARFRVERAAVLAGYDATRWNESVVRVFDSQVLYVRADGSTLSETHELLHLKDLDGCKREGTQSLGGEVVKLVTVKAAEGDARAVELEPVEVDGEYVMPSLKPGDSIERIWRQETDAPAEGLQGLGSWTFASFDEPFHRSRYVVVLPVGHGLELVQRRFRGTHEVVTENGLEIHVFEMRDVPRVEQEPGTPPPNWVLPWVQFGRRRDVPSVMRHLLFETARLAARVTPEIEAKTKEVVRDVEGEEARAQALHAFVQQTVRTPNPRSGASAVATLLQEEGNPVHLYSAMLAASGIEHELAWSTDFSPECDPNGDDPFQDFGRFGSRLLVRVRPRGAAEAWCDLAIRDLPYGRILGNAPRAEALTLDGVVHLPDLTLEERTGTKMFVGLVVGEDGGAEATLRLESTGNGGYAGKDRFKELPEAQRKAALGQVFARMLPGFELATLETPGIEDGPLVLVGHGRVRKLLDADGDTFTMKFPSPAMNLSAGLAGGEGERKLPYFLGSAIVAVVEVELELPEGMRLVDGPPKTNANWQGGRFEFAIEPESERKLRLVRRLLLAPFFIQPNDYPRFARFCAQADEVERVPLRFAK